MHNEIIGGIKIVERTISGTIEQWSEVKPGFKKDNTPFAKASILIRRDWHSFFKDNPEQIKNMMEETPVGSNVSFIQWQNEGDQYWNFKDKSFNILSKGTGTAQQPNKDFGQSNIQELIIKQTCIKAASEIIASYPKEWKTQEIEYSTVVSATLKIAECFQKWIKEEKKNE